MPPAAETPIAAKLVNLGCGARFHPAWINYDIVSRNPAVIAHDLRAGIPLPDNSCDAVYHSHILEHMRRDEALPFLRECRRVLKPGGVIRIATPDLERIGRLYLEKLDAAAKGTPGAAADYDWMLLEMYDQTVREQPGGKMSEFLLQNPPPNAAFVSERIGEEAAKIVAENAQKPAKQRSLFAQILRKPRLLWDLLVKGLLRVLGGAQAPRALDLGRYRLSGEAHLWMYDRFSLGRLLRDAGFENPTVRQAAESAIPGWANFYLDTTPGGAVVKPDSIFMEATKPG
ncbi:MAG TPA: methyltransferase domain-containing protein [Opitutales bacterium]|nr:methyltransferase domain-containing protein [Opitutales bacterium]